MSRIESLEMVFPEVSGLWNSGKIETKEFLIPDYEWSKVMGWWKNLINKFKPIKMEIENYREERVMDRVESFEIANPEISILWNSGEIELLQSSTNTTTVTLSGEGKGGERIIEEAIITAKGNHISVERIDKSKTFSISIDRKNRPSTTRVASAFFGIENKVKIQIQHPHAASLAIKVISSNITGNTDIDSIDVHTVSGNSHFSGQSKEIKIKSISGDTTLDRAAKDRTLVSTISGSTKIAALGGGSIDIKSVSGDSFISVVSGLTVDVDAQTQAGKLTSDIPLDGSADSSQANQGVLRIQTKSLSGDTKIMRVE